MFDTFGGFFAAYIPLVVLAVFGIIFEDKLIAFEQKLRKKIKKWVKESVAGTHG